jgi:hypothetical protein
MTFGDEILRRISEPKRQEVTGERENYIMRSSIICTLHLIPD